MRRGRALVMKVGDAEVEYDPRFRLYLATKLSNPHYKPEVAAQTTLVNFCVTERVRCFFEIALWRWFWGRWVLVVFHRRHQKQTTTHTTHT